MMVAFAMVALLSSRYRSGAAVLFVVASSIHEVRWVVYPGAENVRWDVESGDSLCAVARRVATGAGGVAREAGRVSADVRRVAPYGRWRSGSGWADTNMPRENPGAGWLVGYGRRRRLITTMSVSSSPRNRAKICH